MAKTDGRGNPRWTRDETILALNLLFEAEMAALPDSDARVIALSKVLRQLPGNELWAERATFRNPAGVAFKLSNLLSVATGRGFANASATDKAVWSHFENRRSSANEVSKMILTHARTDLLHVTDDNSVEEFVEGSILTRTHNRIERNRMLRKKLISDRLKKEKKLSCDACNTLSLLDRPDVEDAIFEVHHLVPLSKLGTTTTTLTDVALLCANCHRMAHRLISKSGRWMSIEDIRQMLLHA